MQTLFDELAEADVTANERIPRLTWDGKKMSQGILYNPPANATETSRAAAASIKESAENLRWRVLNFIRQRGNYGATRQEIEGALRMDGNTCRPRVWELLKAGQIREQNYTRETLSGRAAKVLTAT